MAKEKFINEKKDTRRKSTCLHVDDRVQFLEPHLVPQTPPGLFPEHRAKNSPRKQLGMVPRSNLWSPQKEYQK